MNLTVEETGLPDAADLEIEDKWVLSKLNTLIKEVTENMDAYELGVASAKVYDFIWDTYCDWYIELTKARLYGENEKSKLAAQKVLVYVLDQFLRLLHPFMPFITEEIWQAIPHEGKFLMLADWPKYDESLNFGAEAAHMESVMNAIRSIRNRRAEMNVPPSKKSTLYVVSDKGEIFRQGEGFICRLAYADKVIICETDPEGHENMVCVVTNDAKLYIPLEELIDFEKELARLEKGKGQLPEADRHVRGQALERGLRLPRAGKGRGRAAREARKRTELCSHSWKKVKRGSAGNGFDRNFTD